MKLLLILTVALLLPAESIHSLLPEPGPFKMSDGLVLHWNVNANGRDRDAIEAFDRNGVRVLGVNVYKLLPFAKTISISDVAVLRNESIAVAVVTRETDDQTRAWILQVGWDARLTRVTELDAAKEIGWLDFDNAGNIWGLTDYLGEKVRKDTIYNGVPCPLGPLILVFNPEGKIVKSLLKQADFPDSLREGSAIGQVSFGLTNDKVWFWQPAKHRMIVTDREAANVRKISIPHARTWNLGGQTLLTPTGEVVQDLNSPTPAVRGIYLAGSSRVERFRHPQNAYLAGMDGSEFVFLTQTNTAGDSLITANEIVRRVAEHGEARTAARCRLQRNQVEARKHKPGTISAPSASIGGSTAGHQCKHSLNRANQLPITRHT